MSGGRASFSVTSLILFNLSKKMLHIIARKLKKEGISKRLMFVTELKASRIVLSLDL